MIVPDANYILRYLLRDDETMYRQAKETIEERECLVPGEVIAETVYVLSGYYDTPRDAVAEALGLLIGYDNLKFCEPKEVLTDALKNFSETKLDYVDCFLCALGDRHTVATFDKGVRKCLKKRRNP